MIWADNFTVLAESKQSLAMMMQELTEKLKETKKRWKEGSLHYFRWGDAQEEGQNEEDDLEVRLLDGETLTTKAV